MRMRKPLAFRNFQKLPAPPRALTCPPAIFALFEFLALKRDEGPAA
jgi:hypothetical protein